MMQWRWWLIRALLMLLCPMTALADTASDVRVTILSDAFSRRADLHLDWGFAALIEYNGKRILFDAGNDSEHFAANTKALGVDLTRLDFVAISHRHGDHTDGLRHLLEVNPAVKVYAPDDEYFGGPTPPVFFKHAAPELPAHMRYFRGNLPAVVPHGSPWRGANVQRVSAPLQIEPGVRLVTNRAPAGAFTETPEVSLILDTPEGQIIIVGCSHPGIETILTSANAKQQPVRIIIGGLHLVTTPEDAVKRLANALREEWKVAAVAPGHCTGEHAFAALIDVYGARYHYAGVGSVIELPTRP